MRVLMALLAINLIAIAAPSAARADPPEYGEDPFGDSDFQETPLILDVAHPTNGRGELSLLFTSSIIDKYNSHIGWMIDFEYHFFDTMGVGVSFGHVHGTLTNIVTDAEGIIGNKVEKCVGDPSSPTCNNPKPDVPDFKQVTGMADLYFLWSPLYGKINVVSELDVNLQIYGLIGLGVNGTRETQIDVASNPVVPTDFRLSNDGYFDDGLFSNPKFHGLFGFGLRLYLIDWLALRGEVRGLFYGDEFDFDRDQQLDGYLSFAWFAQAGLAFIVF